MKLSEKLMKLRKENGLSQEEFGNEINVSRQAVSKWELDVTKPDIDKIQEIAKRFNVDYNYLLNDEIDTQEKKVEERPKKKKRKIIFRIILIIIGIYLLISLYKFIALYRFYKIADSFSEENYYVNKMTYISKAMWGEGLRTNNVIEKVGNRLQETNYGDLNQAQETPIYASGITFVDSNENYACDLGYDIENDIYILYERNDVRNTQEMIEENGPREFTLRNYSI